MIKSVLWEAYQYHNTKREELWNSGNRKEALIHARYATEILAAHNNVHLVVGSLDLGNYNKEIEFWKDKYMNSIPLESNSNVTKDNTTHWYIKRKG